MNRECSYSEGLIFKEDEISSLTYIELTVSL